MSSDNAEDSENAKSRSSRSNQLLRQRRERMQAAPAKNPSFAYGTEFAAVGQSGDAALAHPSAEVGSRRGASSPHAASGKSNRTAATGNGASPGSATRARGAGGADGHTSSDATSDEDDRGASADGSVDNRAGRHWASEGGPQWWLDKYETAAAAMDVFYGLMETSWHSLVSDNYRDSHLADFAGILELIARLLGLVSQGAFAQPEWSDHFTAHLGLVRLVDTLTQMIGCLDYHPQLNEEVHLGLLEVLDNVLAVAVWCDDNSVIHRVLYALFCVHAQSRVLCQRDHQSLARQVDDEKYNRYHDTARPYSSDGFAPDDDYMTYQRQPTHFNPQYGAQDDLYAPVGPGVGVGVGVQGNLSYYNDRKHHQPQQRRRQRRRRRHHRQEDEQLYPDYDDADVDANADDDNDDDDDDDDNDDDDDDDGAGFVSGHRPRYDANPYATPLDDDAIYGGGASGHAAVHVDMEQIWRDVLIPEAFDGPWNSVASLVPFALESARQIHPLMLVLLGRFFLRHGGLAKLQSGLVYDDHETVDNEHVNRESELLATGGDGPHPPSQHLSQFNRLFVQVQFLTVVAGVLNPSAKLEIGRALVPLQTKCLTAYVVAHCDQLGDQDIEQTLSPFRDYQQEFLATTVHHVRQLAGDRRRGDDPALLLDYVAFEKAELDVYWSWFCSPVLKKRLKGLSRICQYIDESEGLARVMKDGRHNTSYRTSVMRTRPLAEWLVERRIIQRMYGDHMHIEVVRRGPQLPRFLGLQGCLTDDDCDLIVNSYCGKHESFRQFVFNSLVEIVQCAMGPQIIFVWRALRNVFDTRPEEVDKPFVDLLVKFTEAAFARCAVLNYPYPSTRIGGSTATRPDGVGDSGEDSHPAAAIPPSCGPRPLGTDNHSNEPVNSDKGDADDEATDATEPDTQSGDNGPGHQQGRKQPPVQPQPSQNRLTVGDIAAAAAQIGRHNNKASDGSPSPSSDPTQSSAKLGRTPPLDASFGCEVLWRMLQSSPAYPQQLTDDALDGLVLLLLRAPDSRFRLSFMKAAVDNVRNHRHVVPSIRLITRVLAQFPPTLMKQAVNVTKSSDQLSVEQVIHKLVYDSECRLLDALVDDVVHFTTKAAVAVAAAGAPDHNQTIRRHLQERLNLMTTLFSRSFVSLEQQLLDRLFSACCAVGPINEHVAKRKGPWTRAVVATIRDSLFDWLRTLVESHAPASTSARAAAAATDTLPPNSFAATTTPSLFAAVSKDLVFWLLDVRVPQLCFNDLSEAAFLLIEALFLYTADCLGHLALGREASPQSLSLASPATKKARATMLRVPPFVVIDPAAAHAARVKLLFRSALEARRVSVGRRAIALLCALQTRLRPQKLGNTQLTDRSGFLSIYVAERTQFIVDCVNRLTALTENLGASGSNAAGCSGDTSESSTAWLQIGRILQLLLALIQEVDRSGMPGDPRLPSETLEGPLTFFARLASQRAKESKISIQAFRNTMVSEIRTEIRDRFHLTGAPVRLIFAGKELAVSDDWTRLHDAGIKEGVTVQVVARPPARRPADRDRL